MNIGSRHDLKFARSTHAIAGGLRIKRILLVKRNAVQ